MWWALGDEATVANIITTLWVYGSALSLLGLIVFECYDVAGIKVRSRNGVPKHGDDGKREMVPTGGDIIFMIFCFVAAAIFWPLIVVVSGLILLGRGLVRLLEYPHQAKIDKDRAERRRVDAAAQAARDRERSADGFYAFARTRLAEIGDDPDFAQQKVAMEMVLAARTDPMGTT